MQLRRFVAPVVALAILGGAGYAGYRTREVWWPHVFPAGKSADDHDHDHAADDRDPEQVWLSPQAQRNLGLVAEPVVPREYWRTVLVPGVVVDRPGESDRGVTSKVAGVVTAIRARPGDAVRAGDPLFTLQLASEFLQAAQADLAKAAGELKIVTSKRDRLAAAQATRPDLVSEATLIEAENAVSRAATQVRALRRQLQTFGLAPDQADRAEKGEAVTELTVVAPAHADAKPGATADAVYELQELKVHLGEQVQAGQTLCLLADHRRLFVEGRAFKSEADALAAAAEKQTPIRAEFADETAGTWPEQGPLVVHHLANQIDPASRTFAFYLSLDNRPRAFERDGKPQFVWRYRPGQRVRLRVPVEKLTPADGTLPLVLPAGAVVREGPEAFLFVKAGDVFMRKPVRVLHEDRQEVVVANDGVVGTADRVVRNQAAALNRALKAQAAEAEHGHDHGHDH